MKKVIYDRYGGVDVLTLADVPVPTTDKDSLLIRVKAVSINPLDWKIREGDLKILTGFSFPKSVGLDFSGTVEEVGASVQDFKKGDEVLGITDIFSGNALAEYVVVKPETITHKPATISFEEAAALPIVGSSAIQIFDKLAPLQAGMDVLIIGATGGIGTNAVQIAKRRGAHVTAVVGSKSVDLAHQLGSDVVVNYDQQDVFKSSARYDVIVDLSGKIPYSQAESSMKPESVYVTTIPSPIETVSSFVHDIFSKKKREVLSLKASRAYLDQLSDLAANGLIIPISQTHSITAVQQAYVEAAKGGVLGKAVITL